MTFVTLRGITSGDDLVCDSPGNAVRALDALGMCMNWASVTVRQNGGRLMLYYEGWLYQQTPERFIRLPFLPLPHKFDLQATELLHGIFDPFTTGGTENIIKVCPHPTEDRCSMVHLVLFFKPLEPPRNVRQEIETALGEVEDAHEAGEAAYFFLD
jgi:hypothetical protein